MKSFITILTGQMSDKIRHSLSGAEQIQRREWHNSDYCWGWSKRRLKTFSCCNSTDPLDSYFNLTMMTWDNICLEIFTSSFELRLRPELSQNDRKSSNFLYRNEKDVPRVSVNFISFLSSSFLPIIFHFAFNRRRSSWSFPNENCWMFERKRRTESLKLEN